MKISGFALIPAGLALLLTAAPAPADITVSLTVGQTTYNAIPSVNTPAYVIDLFNVPGLAITVDTSMSNQPGNSVMGQLMSNFSISPSGTGTVPSAITVNVTETDPFTAPTPSIGGYSVLDSATGLAGPSTLQLQGNAIFNGVAEAELTVTPTTAGGTTSTQNAPATGPTYTLGQTFTLSGITASSGFLSAGFNSTITASTSSTTVSPAVVPEPSSLVLTGLVSLGLGAVGLRRHLRARPV